MGTEIQRYGLTAEVTRTARLRGPRAHRTLFLTGDFLEGGNRLLLVSSEERGYDADMKLAKRTIRPLLTVVTLAQQPLTRVQGIVRGEFRKGTTVWPNSTFGISVLDPFVQYAQLLGHFSVAYSRSVKVCAGHADVPFQMLGNSVGNAMPRHLDRYGKSPQRLRRPPLTCIAPTKLLTLCVMICNHGLFRMLIRQLATIRSEARSDDLVKSFRMLGVSTSVPASVPRFHDDLA